MNKERMKPMWVVPEFHKFIKSEAANRGVTIKKLTSQLAKEAKNSKEDLNKRGGLRFRT